MGQQQLMLIILAVLIVGIAMAIGVSLFTSQSIESDRDAIVADLGNISTNAYRYYIRPVSIGGGGGRFDGYKIPARMATDDNATYDCGTPTGTVQIKIIGTSIANPGSTVSTIFQVATGKDTAFEFTGAFAPEE